MQITILNAIGLGTLTLISYQLFLYLICSKIKNEVIAILAAATPLIALGIFLTIL